MNNYARHQTFSILHLLNISSGVSNRCISRKICLHF